MADLDFGEALRILQGGGCVARRGWNGKGMYLFLVPAAKYTVQNVNPRVQKPWIAMRTADGGVVPWLASQSDLLEKDWAEP